MKPRYSYPPYTFAGLVRDILLLRRRDFHNDAKGCIDNLVPPLKIFGQEHIPQTGPCVITFNHYHRDGFSAEWLSLAVASQVPVPMHWIMTGEFMYEGKWYRATASKASRVLLKRIALVYDFTNMPPMPPRDRDVQQRAAAVRAVLEYVRRTENPIIGIAPEGYDPPAGTLTRPAPGLGRFALLLSRAGLRFCPVGIYEEDERLHIHFGEMYELTVASHVSSDERDAQAAQIIMKNIAQLLPVRLRGDYA